MIAWTLYSSVGTYSNEGFCNILTSGNNLAGFLGDKVTIGLTYTNAFKIDYIVWDTRGNPGIYRKAKNYRMYGSNTSYIGNISSALVSSTGTLLASGTFSSSSSNDTITFSNPNYYSSYYFDILDNYGDTGSIKVTGIRINSSNTVLYNGGGLNGNGGDSGIGNGPASGGGGFNTSGGNGYDNSTGGTSFLSGGTGGNAGWDNPSYSGGNGGFGGGGGGWSNVFVRGGGGGGYSGGQGGTANYLDGGGGGGGSINNGTSTSNVISTTLTQGSVTIIPNFTISATITTTTTVTTPAGTANVYPTYPLSTPGGVTPYSSLTMTSSVIPYTASTTPLLTYTDSATAFSTQVSSVATNSQYNRAVVGGSGVQFVAGGRGGTSGGLVVSNDGQNWTAAGAGAATVFQTPTNLTTRTGGGGFDASFGTVALTQRLTTPTTYPVNLRGVSLSSTGQYQSAVVMSGNIWTSSDYGVTWTSRTAPGSLGWISVSLSSTGQYQSAVVSGGHIWTSTDYGVTWTSRTSPGSNNWTGVSLSSTGQYQTAVVYGGNIWTSSDYGVSWRSRTAPGTLNWRSVSLSSTGQYQSVVIQSGNIWTSSDYGVSWSSRATALNWFSVSLSSTGQYQSAVVYTTGNIWTSSDFGVTWTSRATALSWYSVSLSSTGQYQTAAVTGTGSIWTSSDYGVTWMSRVTSQDWFSVSLSSTGQYQTATRESGSIFTSTNYGVTWVQRSTSTRTNAFTRIKSSASGQYQIATSGPVGNSNGQFYVSSNYGQTWIPKRGLGAWLGGTVSATGAVMTTFSTPTASSAAIIRSTDYGNTFSDIAGTTLSGSAYWKSVSVTNTASNQTAVAYGGGIYRSFDTGTTWYAAGITIDGSANANTVTPRNWQDVAISAETGGIQVACVNGGYLYISSNTGTTWDSSTVVIDELTPQATNRSWQALALSANGQYGLACVNSTSASGFLYRSTNSGGTWSSSTVMIDGVGTQTTNRAWQDVGMSANGKYQVACLNNEQQTLSSSILTSAVIVMVTPPASLTTTFGSSWTQRGGDIDGEAVGDQSGYSVSMSADGTVVAIGAPMNYGANGRESGQVRVYAWNGSTWTQRGADIDGATGMSSLPMVVTASGTSGSRSWKQICISSTGQYQSAVVTAGNIWTSDNFGVTWTERVVGGSAKNWSSVYLSSSGQYQSAPDPNSSNTWTSYDFGITWNSRTTGSKEIIALSSTGKYQTAVSFPGFISTSSDFGISWVDRTVAGNRRWRSISLSSTGQYQTAVVDSTSSGNIWTSSDYGETWTARNPGNFWWVSVSVSSSGKYQTATAGDPTIANDGYIWVSTDFGVSWTSVTAPGRRYWMSVSVSSSGQYQSAVYGATVIASSDFGVTWSVQITFGGSSLQYISLSSTGQYQSTTLFNGLIYFSRNYGFTWSEYASYEITEGDRSGSSVSLSANGNTVAVGSPYYNLAGILNRGQVRVFDWSGSTWSARGSNILIGEGSNDYSGMSMSLSKDGKVVAIGAPLNDGSTGTDSGHVRVYAWDGSAWSQRGSDIDGKFGLTATNRVVTAIGNSGNRSWSSLSISSTGQYQTAVVSSGGIYTSYNYGINWTLVPDANGAISGNWISVSISSTGQYQSAVISGGGIYTSYNFGVTWSLVPSGNGAPTSVGWSGVNVSSTGQYQNAAIGGGGIYISSNYGVNWSLVPSANFGSSSTWPVIASPISPTDASWYALGMSSTGQYQSAAQYMGGIFCSSDYGNNWAVKVSPGGGQAGWFGMAISSSGQYQTAMNSTVGVYRSSDFGASWTKLSSSNGAPNSESWRGISISSTGQYQTAVNSGSGGIYISSDFGLNWSLVPSGNGAPTNVSWGRISVSSTGQYQTAMVSGGLIYFSRNYGFTWSTTASYEITEGDQSGYSVSLSADGSALAIGAVNNDSASGIDRGHVRVYTWSGSAWSQRGIDIDGESTNDKSGWSASMSADGTTVAIGAPYNNGVNGIGSGQVRVYKWSGTAWSQFGTVDIDGEAGVLTPPRVVSASGANGSISSQMRTISVSSSGQYQTVCGINRGISTSYDYGVTWTGRMTGNLPWASVSISSTGQYQTSCRGAGNGDGFVYTSYDFGVTWTERITDSARNWQWVSISATGQYQSAVGSSFQIYKSSNYGVSWAPKGSSKNWTSISMSSNGQYQTAVVGSTSERIYTSSDYGETWTERTQFTGNWASISVSSTGQYQTAMNYSGGSGAYIYRSEDFGISWSQIDVAGVTWNAISISSTGQYQTAAAWGGLIYVSSNFGKTWTSKITSNAINWTSISVSSTGQYQTGVSWGTSPYFSRDYGNTWSTTASYEVVTGGDQSGYSLSLSASGNTLAVGAPYNDAGASGADRGQIRVYDYNVGSTTWTQRGSDIDGEASDDLAGWSVSLSSDGSTVAFGSPMNDAAGNLLPNSGSVRVFNVAVTNGITYTSSNSSVADICGNLLLIKGTNGTSNIVATQGATTTNGTLTVSGTTYTMAYIIGSVNQGQSSLIYYSKDYGATWVSFSSAGSRSWSSIALSENGSTISATTTDTAGAIWTYTMPDDQYYLPAVLANSGSSTTISTVRAVAYGNSGTGAATDGYWVAGADASANTLAYSSNGIDWTAVVGSKTALFNAVNGVAYGVDTSGTPVWVAVGLPFVGSVVGLTAYSIAYSYNMTTWVGVRNNTNFTGQGNHVAYGQDEFGAGMWVAVGQGDGALSINLGDSTLYNSNGNTNTTIFYSYDGANWAAATGAGVFSTSGTDVTWGVDASGVATWVATGVGLTDPLTGIFIAGGQVAYSINGRVWAPIRVPRTISPALSTTTLPATTRGSAMIAPSASTGFITPTYNNIWRLLGRDIDGEAANDQSGYSVSLSADGNVVAIGALLNDGTTGTVGDNRGHVRVYAWNGVNAWIQRGADIDGAVADDQSGFSVSLSADGTILAIGATVSDLNGTNSGHVRVFAWNGVNAWVQRGANIIGEATSDNSGWSVSLSADGNVVAIGAINNDGSGTDAGQTRIYAWNGTAWSQRGADIDGESAADNSGISVSLSADGTVVAIGAIYNDGSATNAGHVRVYAWNGSAWVRRGADIDGEAASDHSGISVSLSADGTVVAIGAQYNDGSATDAGHVRVYAWNGTAWAQRGADIDGEAASDNSGYSVSLSADGSIVAIGARNNDGSATDAGHVRVYKYNAIKTVAITDQSLPNFGPVGWDRIGVDIDGESGSDRTGYSISLSADGTTLAIGADLNDANGQNTGHVRVYKLDTFGAITYTSSNPSVADIYGNAILLIKEGASGTSTITATQAATPPFTTSPVTVQGTLTVSGTTYTLEYNSIMAIYTPFTVSALTVAYGRAGSQGTGAPLWIVGGSGTNVFAMSSRPSAITTNAWSIVGSNVGDAPFTICNSIGYSNGVWVAGNNTDTTNILARSVNGGVTWTPVTSLSMSSILTGTAAVGTNSFCNYSLAYADFSNDTNLRSWVAIPGTKNFMFETGVNAVATVTPNIVASTYNSSGGSTQAWWVAGGVGLSGVAAIGYTTDPSGATGWTKSASTGITNLASINSVAFSPFTQQWLAVGAGASGSTGTNILFSDASGATWTSTSVATAATPVITLNTCVWNQLPELASSTGRWLVGGTRNDGGINNVSVANSASVYISTDVSGSASPWTPVSGTGAILSQVYSLAYNGRVWIAAGVPATDGGSTSTLMRTTDPSGASGWVGIATTNTSVTGFDTAARSITWNADQLMWVATGENTATSGSGGAVDASFSSVIYSLDVSGGAGTWRSVRETNSLCFSGEGTGIAFTGDKWFAAGEGNKQIVATTGTNAATAATASWSTVSHATTLTRASDITYTGRRLIATGSGAGSTNGVILSTDNTGASWSAGPSTGFSDSNGGGTSVNFEASYDGVGRVVATGRSDTNTLSVSTDGGSSWSAPTVQFSSTNTVDTPSQTLFTTGGNSVSYVGNDTLFAVGGNDIHWTGKRWVAVGRNSTNTVSSTATMTNIATPDVINNNTTPVATSEDGMMWQCVRASQGPNLSDGTFLATNSRIGSTPLIDSEIIITDGGDTESNMDYGGMTSGIGGSGTGVTAIDIIAELTPSSLAASSIGAVGIIGAAGNGGANNVGHATIASFDTTAFTITTRPTTI